MLEETWSKKQQDRRVSCLLLFNLNIITPFKTKKRQLWDRGFRLNSSLKAVWDTSIARTTGFMWPHQGCQPLLRGTKSDSCGTQWVYNYEVCGYMDTYATFFILVGRNVIGSMRGDEWSCITRWTLYHMHSCSNPAEYCITWAVGHSFNLSITT